MVVLDTNVVSELMLAGPSPAVLDWMDSLATQELFVTAVTEAEVRTAATTTRRRKSFERGCVMQAGLLHQPASCITDTTN